MNRFLPENKRLREAIIAVGVVILTLVFTQLVLPGDKAGGRGVPLAAIFQGLVNGSLYALSALGIVLLYRTQRFINFAAGAIGLVGYVFMLQMLQFTKVPFLITLVLSLALSTLIGVIVGIVLLRFFNSSRLFLTVVTIVGVPTVSGLLVFVNRLPFFPPQNQRPVEGLTPQLLQRLLPFAGWHFQVGHFPIRFGFAQVFALELSAIAFIGIGLFFRYTRTGTAVRALAENAERASLLGIGVGKLSVIIWAIVGLLAGITVCLSGLAASQTTSSGGGTGLEILLPILVAAVLARMQRFDVAIFAAIIIGVLESAWTFRITDNPEMFSVFLLVGVAVALWFQRRTGRSEAGSDVSWSASDEPRPIPKELRDVSALRWTRWGLITFGLLAVIIFPFVASNARVFTASTLVVSAIAVLSLVVLTGWTGQVSLGQYGFVALGAVIGGSLIQRAGFPFWIAVPVAAVLVGVVAIFVGLPALRIKGLFLMVITFGFAVVVRAELFNDQYFKWLLPKASNQIKRPTLFFIDFQDNRSMFFLCVACLVLTFVLIANLRKSRVGRVLIALRENEANVQAFGISVVRGKLIAFAISGMIAGFAGAVGAVLSRAVTPQAFGVDVSINAFVAAVVGGVSSPAGALLGSSYFTLTSQFLTGNVILRTIVGALGPAVILFLAPGGLISLLQAARDSVLRIIAQRRRIVVPSLFADYDPALLARQLIPLGAPDPMSGLAALPHDQRFALESELYQGNGVRIIDKLAPAREAAEAAAIGAAARRVEEIDAAEELEAATPTPEYTT